MFYDNWFKSEAETKVDTIYGIPGNSLKSDADIFGAPATPDNTLSTWDSFKEMVTPKSYAESIVDQVYGPDAKGLYPDPSYDVRDFSSPNVYIAARDAGSKILGSVSATLQGGLIKAALIAGAVLLVVALVHGFAMRR